MQASTPLRVVHVESNMPDQVWLRLILEKIGVAFEVTPFHSVAAAVHLLRSERRPPCDLVVINAYPLDADVNEAIAQLREIEALAKTVIAVTLSSPLHGPEVHAADFTLVMPVDEAQMTSLTELVAQRTDWTPVKRRAGGIP